MKNFDSVMEMIQGIIVLLTNLAGNLFGKGTLAFFSPSAPDGATIHKKGCLTHKYQVIGEDIYTIYIVIIVASNNDIVTCVYSLGLSMMYIKLV
jgi:hypothetical protein